MRKTGLFLAVVLLAGCASFRVEQHSTADTSGISETTGEDIDVTGEWRGSLTVAGTELGITVRFFDETPLRAEIDIPMQGASNLPLEEVRADGAAVYFVLPAGSGKAVFDGKLMLNDSVRSIAGSFKQGVAKGTFEIRESVPDAVNVSTSAGTVESTESAVSVETAEPMIGAEEELAVDVAGGRLYGTLRLPEGNGPFTVLLIIAGSGPTDRNGNNPLAGENNGLKMIADGLAEAGIASLRTDKRGIGASAAALTSQADLKFTDYVDDYAGWYDFLRGDLRFDEIGVFGHSEGSLIGALLAEKEHADFYISAAGPGEPADVLLDRQLTAQLAAQSPPLLDAAREIMAKLKAGEAVEAVPEALNTLFHPTLHRYLATWFQFDPSAVIASLDTPVLLVQGTTDIQVGVENVRMLHAARPDAELLVIEGMNHILKPAPADAAANVATYADPRLPLASGLIEGMIGFIRNK